MISWFKSLFKKENNEDKVYYNYNNNNILDELNNRVLVF